VLTPESACDLSFDMSTAVTAIDSDSFGQLTI
jgi:hypothetical protein